MWPYLFGVLWGIGGLAFGLTMRRLGLSLGMALALGLTATSGPLVPPICFGLFSTLISKISGLVTLAGVLVCLIGIFFTGRAGVLKDLELSSEQKKAKIKKFNFSKGVWVALSAGVMGACFAFCLAAGKPIAESAVAYGTPAVFADTPVFIFIMLGGFTANLLWCVHLAVRNRTVGDYVKREAPPAANYVFSALAGIVWYFQFFFYGIGTTKMGKYDSAGWSMHLALIITFSTLWGLILKERKGAGRQTMRTIEFGLLILIFSTFIIGAGNYIQKFE